MRLKNKVEENNLLRNIGSDSVLFIKMGYTTQLVYLFLYKKTANNLAL